MTDPRLVEALLAQSDWMRRMARSLVRDEATADDLVQDACAEALLRQPETGRPMRGWLATVVRRIARQRRREDVRRRQRECRAAKGQQELGAADVVARVQLQERLVRAVLELREPYRTAVLMRFFDDLPPRRIAGRLGVPVATVNSRLTRGLSFLRARLDAEHGGRSPWTAALVPLFSRSGSSAALLGATAMHTVIKFGAAALVAALGLLLWREHPIPEPASGGEVEGRALAATGAIPPIAVGTTVQQGAGPPERVLVQTPQAGGPLRDGRRVRGRVLDQAGRALADLPVGWPADGGGQGTVATRSGVDGRFELELEERGRALVIVDPAWETVLAGAPQRASRGEVVIVAARALRVSGRVLGERGSPLQDVTIRCDVPSDLGADFGQVLDNSLPMAWRTRSAADGSFRLTVPAVEGGLLRFTRDGYEPSAKAVAATDVAGLEIVLRAVETGEFTVRGTVLDHDGAVAADVRVSCGGPSVTTDDRGAFALEVGDTSRIVAVMPGRLPAVAMPDGNGAWPDPILLRLGAAPLAITGRVVDAEGAPMPGIKVWISDPTAFGMVEGTPLPVESLVARSRPRFWTWVRTDPHGTFRLTGLLDRDYRIGAVDPDTLLGTEVGPFQAGDGDVEVRIPSDRVHPKLIGRVVTRSGEPVADATVALSRITFEVEVEDGTIDDSELTPPVRTGDDGTFELERVPVGGVALRVGGDAVMPFTLPIESVEDPASVELVVSARCHVQVELLGDPEYADRVAVLDAEGRRLLLRIMRGGQSLTDRSAEFIAGRTHVVSVEDRGIEVALLKGGRIVERLPVELVPGRVETVRWSR